MQLKPKFYEKNCAHTVVNILIYTLLSHLIYMEWVDLLAIEGYIFREFCLYPLSASNNSDNIYIPVVEKIDPDHKKISTKSFLLGTMHYTKDKLTFKIPIDDVTHIQFE